MFYHARLYVMNTDNFPETQRVKDGASLSGWL